MFSRWENGWSVKVATTKEVSFINEKTGNEHTTSLFVSTFKRKKDADEVEKLIKNMAKLGAISGVKDVEIIPVYY